MEQKIIENKLKELEANIAKVDIKFESCLTNPGKKFQADLYKLIRLLEKSYSIPVLLQFFNSSKSILFDQISQQGEIDLDNDIVITITGDGLEIPPLKTSFRKLIDDLDVSDPIQNIERELPVYLDALNSYYILSLFAYIDYYISEIYKLLVTTFSESKIHELLTELKPRGKLTDQIEFIVINSNIITKNKFDKLFVDNKWDKIFGIFVKLRNILAHENPQMKIITLQREFNELYESCTLEIQESYTNLRDVVKPNIPNYDHLVEIIKPFIETETLLIEIGKNCFGYIALVDILIDDFLKS
jgi:hypothetical protein